MKIHDYYRDLAGVSLNGSIAALVPSIIIIAANLTYIQNKQIMFMTIPFLIYSLISFQLYLFRMKQSFSIEKNFPNIQNHYHSLFEARHLLLVFMNTQQAKLLLYFPNGHLAGMIRKHKVKMFKGTKIYVLYNSNEKAIGIYKIKGKKIYVFNNNKEYLGCLEKENQSWMKKKKELLDAKGKWIGAVEGAQYFMDERIFNQSMETVGRLRRGWMPLEWSKRFPEPNTPVLSFNDGVSDQDKLLRMAFLINEFFIER